MQDLSASAATQGSGVDVFFKVLREFHSVPHIAGDAKETVDTLKTILGEVQPRSAVAAGLPTPAKMLVESSLKGINHTFVEEVKATEALAVISKADVGITWAEYGVARKGCIVEVAYDDAVKLASSLPRVHVALLSSRNLLPDMPEAVSRVAGILREESTRGKPVVSIISGPSKTADIEMRLVYGVHGPHEVHVVLLDWL